jgi:hypothetical protein
VVVEVEVSVITEVVVEEDSLDLLLPVIFHMLVEDLLMEKQRHLLVLVNLVNTDSLEPEVVEVVDSTEQVIHQQQVRTWVVMVDQVLF